MPQLTNQQKIDQLLLPAVQSPAQYIGGEFNQIRKDFSPNMVRLALAFPDTYAVGMSHLGLSILYHTVNQMPNALAERVFCPWIDAADIMQKENIDLFTWETRAAVRDFDILGITIQHEQAFSNILLLLDLAHIPFRSEHRTNDDPLVIGGGPIADCCEPVADFFDAIILGDGEYALPEFINAYQQLRPQNLPRRELLHQLARRFPWLYVPQLYRCDYAPDGTLTQCAPTEPDIPACVQRAQVPDLDAAPFPTAPIIPHTEAIHNRIAIEIMRGCPGRCAFCHAGHTKGKLRCRSVEKILDIAQQSYHATGHDTISLLSLSTSDYPQLAQLAQKLYDQFADCHVSISLPSLRVDKQLYEVPAQVAGVRKEGLTVAVEAASDKIRLAIGKKITDQDLLATMAAAFQQGWRKVKLYFMIGFPHETQQDIMGILDLASRISRLGKQFLGAPAYVNAAVSWLVPKPHTPFAWIEQPTLEYYQKAKNDLISAKLSQKGANVNLKFHHMERSILEGVFSRGDRRLSAVIEHAYHNGARFDAWNECFDYQLWFDSFTACDIDPAFYCRPRAADEILPWHHLAGNNHPTLYRRLQKINTILKSDSPKHITN
ncbi:MAG: TIGR03960 family B12-binding radical SAM protein [Sedimentisphaerales bacterium]|nr:TIGR03960 family B12-binding radical SAM protein [Sedimentisphaerales bacterium]